MNCVLLEDAVESAREACDALAVYLNHAVTLPQDELLLEVPFVFAGDRVRMHPHRIAGSFACVKSVDDNNAVLIPCGTDDTGAQIIDPPLQQHNPSRFQSFHTLQ